MEPIGHESDSEFEETCVLVDGSDFCIDNHKQEIRRSYKVYIFSFTLLYINLIFSEHVRRLEVTVLNR